MRIVESENGLVIEAEMQPYGEGEWVTKCGPDGKRERHLTAFKLAHVEILRPASAQPKGDG